MDTSVKAFRVRGTTADVTCCELCGRDDLKGTVVLESLDAEGNGTGDVVYYGSDCGARAAGWTVKELRARVKVSVNDLRTYLRAESEWHNGRYCAARDRWLMDHYGTDNAYAVRLADGSRPGYKLIKLFDAALASGDVVL